MKKIIIASFVFLLWGLALQTKAYSVCTPATPSVPCTQDGFDYDSYIGTDSAIIFYKTLFSSITIGDPTPQQNKWEDTGTNNARLWSSCSGVRTSCTNSGDVALGYFYNDGSDGSYIQSETNPFGVDISTRIISLSPSNGTTTGTSVTFALHAYINPNDIGASFGISLYLHNIDQNTLLSGLTDQNIVFLDNFVATTSGNFYYSSTTNLSDGNYAVEAQLQRSYLNGIIVNPFGGVNQNVINKFIVNQSTFLGNISQNSLNSLNDIFASSSATSTSALARSCYPFSGQFDTINCLAFLFIPDAGYLNETLYGFKTKIATHFPLGYISDFIRIISTTTETGLPILEATVPIGIPGAGAHIELNPAHKLDYILNATNTLFVSAEASSTETFYEITSFYWFYLLCLLSIFYILRRILGKTVIPHFKHNDNKPTH